MNQHKQKSGAQALWLSALTAEAGRCILTSGGVSARGLILQGLPVALGISLAAALLQTAEQENDVFSGRTFRDRVVCGGFVLWFAAELWETICQAQELCWEQFSSMAVLGILPLLVWAGWKLEERVFFRAAGILWWAAALFRVCFLVHLLRRLLGLVWNGRRQEVQG